MPETLTTSNRIEPKLKGQKVFLSKQYYSFFKKEVEALVLYEGGEFCEEFSDDIDLAIFSKPGEIAAKKAEKLVKQGAKITILGYRKAGEELLNFFLPNRDETICMLRGAEIERLSNFYVFADHRVPAYGQFDLSGGADLSEITIENCHCHLGNLTLRLSFNSCSFERAHLSNCRFGKIDGATFKGARINGISGTDFQKCDFSQSDWSGSDSSNVRFDECNFHNCVFRNAWLLSMNLENADLSGIDFSHSNLAGSKLTGATIEGANFTGCNLAGVTMDGIKGEAAGFKDALKESMVPTDSSLQALVAELEGAVTGAESYELKLTVEKEGQSVLLLVKPKQQWHNTTRTYLGVYLQFTHRQSQSTQPQANAEMNEMNEIVFPSLEALTQYLKGAYRDFFTKPESIQAKVTKGLVDSKNLRKIAVQCFSQLF